MQIFDCIAFKRSYFKNPCRWAIVVPNGGWDILPVVEELPATGLPWKIMLNWTYCFFVPAQNHEPIEPPKSKVDD